MNKAIPFIHISTFREVLGNVLEREGTTTAAKARPLREVKWERRVGGCRKVSVRNKKAEIYTSKYT